MHVVGGDGEGGKEEEEEGEGGGGEQRGVPVKGARCSVG